MNMAPVAGAIPSARPIEQVFDGVATESNEPRYNGGVARVAEGVSAFEAARNAR
jgi:hypothetical protein